ncbi:MAG: hypothetical protein ACREYF_02980 [Gammaproteobacteria bacterium]
MKRNWGILPIHSTAAAALVLSTGVALTPQWASAADPLSTRVQELEQQLEQMQAELRRLKQGAQEPSVQVRKLDGRMSRVEQSVKQQAEQTPVSTLEVTDLEERVARVERVDKYKNNTIFFRGGYTNIDDSARGFESFTDTHNTIGLGTNNPADEGWYVGGAIEHSITTDLWGLLPGTEALGEISLEYKKFETEPQTVVVPTAECALGTLAVTGTLTLPQLGGCVVTGDIALTMFTVSASPKLKFLEGSDLRPWIIPAGLDFHVISPPSDSATYLDVGVQFAAGMEYELLPGIVVGIDGRYHLTANISNSENNFTQVTGVAGNTDHEFNFWTAGGYAGFRF